jgi:hypothetical protein
MPVAWATPSPGAKYGGSFLTDRIDPGAASTGTVGVAGPPAGQHAKAWHPDNAMFWVAGLIVIVFGIGGASTTFRVGSAKATAAVGKP